MACARIYKLTNVETGRVYERIPSHDVRSIIPGSFFNISEKATRKAVVNGFRIEFDSSDRIEKIFPFTRETYQDWIDTCAELKRMNGRKERKIV